MNVSMTINGEAVSREVEARTLLVHFIREDLDMTGTKIGCDTSQCGACTIHVNGKVAKACTLLAAQADGADITTIEGLAENGEHHPMQTAFWENHGLQCGYCTPGMIMASAAFVRDNPGASEDEIRHYLEGNICRCTGYHNIVKAVKQVADAAGGAG
ncbi:MAG: (2Fe-2S)-binding protein [Chloroflexi bacterium]|nr:(2Fe-2S)-binding protein [Chloroflexota bacterium]